MLRTVCALFVVLLAAPPVFAESTLFPFAIEQTRLQNGLTVVVVPLSGTKQVGYRTIIRTGSRDEYEPKRTGFAHFFEHMMFRGTKKFPADIYGRLMTEMGVDGNAYTSDDVTVYNQNFVSQDLARVMELESDRFKNLDYPKSSFQTEAGAVYGEYRKNRASPFFTLEEKLVATAFTRHTYGHTGMGYEADIKNMPNMFDYSRSFFERYYRPDNAIVLVVGDVGAAQVFQMAETYYGDWKPGYVAPKVKGEPEQKKARNVDVSYDGRSLPILWLAYKGDAFSPESRTYAAAAVLAALAFGETSAAYKNLVLDQQLVESLSAQAASSRDPGLFHIVAMVKEVKNIDRVKSALLATIEEFQKAPPDAKRVAEVKSNLRYGFLMGLSSPADVADQLGHLMGVWGSLANIETYYQTLNQVTPEDVQAAAKAYLQPARSTTALLKGKE